MSNTLTLIGNAAKSTKDFTEEMIAQINSTKNNPEWNKSVIGVIEAINIVCNNELIQKAGDPKNKAYKEEILQRERQSLSKKKNANETRKRMGQWHNSYKKNHNAEFKKMEKYIIAYNDKGEDISELSGDINTLCYLNGQLQNIIKSRNETKYEKIEELFETIQNIVSRLHKIVTFNKDEKLNIYLGNITLLINDITFQNDNSLTNSIRSLKTQKLEKEEQKRQLNRKLQTNITEIKQPGYFSFSKTKKNDYNKQIQHITEQINTSKQKLNKEIEYLTKKRDKLHKIKMKRVLQAYTPAISTFIDTLLKDKNEIVMNKSREYTILDIYEKFFITYINLLYLNTLRSTYIRELLDRSIKGKMEEAKQRYRGVINKRKDTWSPLKLYSQSSILKALEFKINTLYPKVLQIIEEQEKDRIENIYNKDKEVQMKYNELLKNKDVPIDFFKNLLEIIESIEKDYIQRAYEVKKRIIQWETREKEIRGRSATLLEMNISETKDFYNRNLKVYLNTDGYLQYINDKLERSSLGEIGKPGKPGNGTFNEFIQVIKENIQKKISKLKS